METKDYLIFGGLGLAALFLLRRSGGNQPGYQGSGSGNGNAGGNNAAGGSIQYGPSGPSGPGPLAIGESAQPYSGPPVGSVDYYTGMIRNGASYYATGAALNPANPNRQAAIQALISTDVKATPYEWLFWQGLYAKVVTSEQAAIDIAAAGHEKIGIQAYLDLARSKGGVSGLGLGDLGAVDMDWWLA